MPNYETIWANSVGQNRALFGHRLARKGQLRRLTSSQSSSPHHCKGHARGGERRNHHRISSAISPHSAYGDTATPRLASRVPHTGPAPPVGPDASGAEGRFPTPASKMPGARGKKTQGTHDWIGTLLDENTGDAPQKKKRGRPASRKPTASDGSDSRYPPASSPLFQSLSSSPKFSPGRRDRHPIAAAI